MIPYGRQSIDESDINAVLKVLGSDFLTCGPSVDSFEQKLCSITGARYAVACSNGTAALHLACMALGIKKGDIGITSPITFLASANCVEYCGGSIDFIDIDADTLCLSVSGLESYCKTGKKPTVVIPVDFAGVPADLPALWELANTYGFKVIEDAAHAMGSTYIYEGKTYHCGSCAHSDLAIFSFHPVKTITTGEGGAIMTNDERLAERLRLLRNHGMTKDPDVLTRNDGPWYYEMNELGYNYRITDIQCALGLSQLGKLTEFKDRRQEIVKRYNMVFKNIKELILPLWAHNASPCFHLYPLQFKKGSNTRKKVYEELKLNNILTQVHYIPIYWQPYYRNKYNFTLGKCPMAEIYYQRSLSLPLFPKMTNEDIDFVINSVQAVLN